VDGDSDGVCRWRFVRRWLRLGDVLPTDEARVTTPQQDSFPGCCVMFAVLSILAATFAMGMAFQSMQQFEEKLDKAVAAWSGK
jgi:hypothetical protein